MLGGSKSGKGTSMCKLARRGSMASLRVGKVSVAKGAGEEGQRDREEAGRSLQCHVWDLGLTLS